MEAIQEFQEMRDMAELKALSKYSLQNPLSNWEFQRIKELAKKLNIKL